MGGLPISRRWLDAAPSLRHEFETASPFPILVLDDFLDPDLAGAVVEEFPPLDAMPRSRDYVFADKRELSSLEEGGHASSRLHDALAGPDFAAFLHAATGFDVFVDPTFFGGGYHQGGDGSYLDMHVDFNVHPLHEDWLRTLNILVYLNPGWQDAWGGHLLVKARPDDEPRAVAPLFNRAVVMLTDAHTYHGYRRMRLPGGVTRRSIAAYGYQRVADGAIAPRTTGWVPESAGVVKRTLARHYGRLVHLKHQVSPSRTARNR